ncbi:hypothetical protein ACFQ1S_27615 [Kibdelosporangium lantanae]|uniref:Immunity protein 50 n=1 Tax=Kibdelosporangium lantanae TaxID=1497396 RepID=A0ABW3MEI8_9PSEU
MTRTWADHLPPGVVRKLERHFVSPPDLVDVVVRSIRFEHRGPGCTLRLDLPGPVQCNLGFMAVEDVRLNGGPLPDTVTISLSPLPLPRLAVTVTGTSTRLSLTCADQLRFGRVSTHPTPPAEVDTGPHVFDSKLDQRLYTTVPGPEVHTYHERF